MAQQGSRGVARVLAKLKSSVEEGRYYEAHQMYRTLYFRCGKRRVVVLVCPCSRGGFICTRLPWQTVSSHLSLHNLSYNNNIAVLINIRGTMSTY